MKFKKHISLLLALFLLVSNTGFAVGVHYCGGEVASIKPIFWKTIETANNEVDGCCPPKVDTFSGKEEGCCQDKVRRFQKKSGKVSLNSISFQADFIFIVEEWNPIIVSKFSNFKNNCNSAYHCDANALPLFKLYQQYIYYA